MPTASILSPEQINRKIERMAWQLYELHSQEEEVHLVGIAENGYEMARRTEAILKKISPLRVHLHRLELNKRNLLAAAPVLGNPADFSQANVVVMDDVLNTGGTLMYGLRYFLDYPVKRLTTAVLVDRNHKKFPVKADVKGISLSTSMREHVEVILKENEEAVVLS